MRLLLHPRRPTDTPTPPSRRPGARRWWPTALALGAAVLTAILVARVALPGVLHHLPAAARALIEALAFAGILTPPLLWTLRRRLDASASSSSSQAAPSADYQRLAMVAERTTNAVIITDARRRITWVNEGFTRVTGYTLEEVLGKSPGTLLQFEKTNPETVRTIREALNAGRPFRGEILNKSKTGREYWLDVDIQPLNDASGAITGFVAIESDISPAKELETRLSEAKQRAEAALREVSALRTALDEHSIMSVADRTGKIIEVNTGFCRISGYDREELLGKDHRMLNSGIQPREFWVNVWRTIASGRAWRGEVCNRAKDGSLYWVDSTIVPCRGTDGAIEKYVSIRFDITHQKSAEAALLEARAQADAASRSKSEFLANMSHEIRTPMTAILGFTDLLSENVNPDCTPRQRQDYIDTIRRNGEHLLAIINDILDISKIEAGKLTVENVPTSPHQIIEDVLTLMNVKARAKGIVLESVDETPIPETIHSDPVRLRQILVNLVGNAIKFTEIGGVTIHVGFEASNGGTLNFSVQDTGIGLTQEQQSRLFSAFSQADASTTRRYGGTGLGLRICKRLVEMLGGTVSVSSQIGKGSTFDFSIRTGDLTGIMMIEPGRRSIDAETAAKPVERKPDDAATPRPLEGVRILLAEDGPDNVRLISFHLRTAGADVRSVQNGRLAVEALTTDATLEAPLLDPLPVDVILTDMQMPEMDGYAATRLLREKGCKLPIVALTAHAMDGDAEKCFAAGCDDYATKPLDRTKLIKVCQAAAERGPKSAAA